MGLLQKSIKWIVFLLIAVFLFLGGYNYHLILTFQQNLEKAFIESTHEKLKQITSLKHR